MNYIYKYLRKKLDSESRKLVRNSTWMFISNINSTFCFFIRSIILARTLGADGFGLFVLIFTYISALLEITNLNLPSALTKYGASYLSKDHSPKLIFLIRLFFITSLSTTLAGLLLLTYLLSNYYNYFIDIPGLNNYILLFAAAIGLRNMSWLLISILHLKNMFRFHSSLKIFQDWLELLSIIYFYFYTDHSIKSLLFIISIAILLHTFIYIFSTLIRLKSDLLLIGGKYTKLERNTIKDIFNFILINSPSNTIMMGIRYIDTISLGLFSSNSQVGYYTIAKRLGNFILRFSDPMAKSIYPQLSILVSKDRLSELKMLVRNILKFGSAIIIAVMLCGFAFGEYIIVFMYGNNFGSSYNSFIILLLSGSLSALLFWINPITLSFGMVKQRLVANTLVLLFLIPSSFYLSSTYGSIGIAFAMLAANIIYYYILSRYLATRLSIFA